MEKWSKTFFINWLCWETLSIFFSFFTVVSAIIVSLSRVRHTGYVVLGGAEGLAKEVLASSQRFQKNHTTQGCKKVYFLFSWDKCNVEESAKIGFLTTNFDLEAWIILWFEFWKFHQTQRSLFYLLKPSVCQFMAHMTTSTLIITPPPINRPWSGANKVCMQVTCIVTAKVHPLIWGDVRGRSRDRETS